MYIYTYLYDNQYKQTHIQRKDYSVERMLKWLPRIGLGLGLGLGIGLGLGLGLGLELGLGLGFS